jgi:hypothetical protein
VDGKMRLAGNITGMGEIKKYTKFWSETVKGKIKE